MREARSAAAFNHPNAVAVYDVVDHDGRPWLVMEYVDGETLADEISRNGQLSPQRVADIGAQLAGALACAHERRIVHRDIKPGNVLIDKAGRPKISDFGIARRHGDDQLTAIGFVTGTPGYLSPELARGGDPDWASDVWALGATLYAAVEGRPAYEPRSNPIALLRDIASERPRPMRHAGAIRPAIDAMMREDPACRWDMATSAKRLGGIDDGHVTAVMPRVDPAATAAMPLVSTAATTAMPRVDPIATQIISAPPVERTKSLPAAAPVAAAAAAWRPEPAGPHAVHGGAALPPQDDRSGDQRSDRRWRLVLFVAVFVAALGVGYLVSPIGNQTGATTVPGRASVPAPVKAGAASSAPSATAATDPNAASDPKAAKNIESFVISYYSHVTKDTDRTWEQLTPTMQNAAGGRDVYDSFWKTIDKVEVNQTRVNASANTAVVSLTYTRDDGTTSTETREFTFVTQDGDYLIDSDRLG